jgi:methanogenic corrinoid protein MtbC1
MIEKSSYIPEFKSALLSMDRLTAKKIMEEATKSCSPGQIPEALLTVTLEEIGEGWEKGNISLSQVYMSSRICEDLVSTVLFSERQSHKDMVRMAIAILEDYHLLGKRIVYSILRASGYDLYDYGTMEVESLINRAIRDNLQVILISTLMLPSALKVKAVTSKLKETNPEIKIFVGGAPFRFDEELWKEVGADGMGKTASDAIKLVRTVSERR